MTPPKFLPSTIARIVDVMVFVISGLLAFYSYEAYQDVRLDLGRYAVLILLAALLFVFLSSRLYRSWRSEGFFKLIQSIGAVIAKTWILIIFGLFFTKTNDYYSRTWIVAWAIYAFLGLLLARYFMYVVLGKLRILGMNQKHVAIIGSSGTAQELQERITRSPWSGFKVEQFLANPNQEQLNDLAMQSFDEIWLALAMDEQHQIGMLMEGLKNSTANVRLVPDWFSYRLINHGVSEVLGVEMVDLYGTPMTGSNLLVKTIEDFVLSLLIVILLSPLYLLLAILVKVSSSGPVFYRQARVGWNGEIFEILKFRTMPVNTEKEGVVWGNSADKAVSPISRWMRKTSLDELPQFFNVLSGDMSIVGPRPERPEFVEKFKEEIPGYMKKHLVKAGITGWAQIHGWRGDTDLKTRIEYDLFYIDNWSLMLDLKIIFYTPWRGLVNKNAY
jgi:putative colanic acid biosysnthesis UDP-glucose lipid carrier transferase